MVIAVEVVVKLADSIVEITRVPRGGSYTHPLLRFPLVVSDADGFVVHRPLVPSVRVSDTVVLELERATLFVVPVIGVVAPLARRPIDWRPWWYGIAVLAAHLVVWGLAQTQPAPRAVVRPLPSKRPVRALRSVEPPPPPPPAAAVTAEPSVEPARVRSRGSKRRRAAPAATSGTAAMLGAFGDISMLIPKSDVRGLTESATAYDEQAAEEARFGGGRRFDPTRNCTDCGLIAAGAYETMFTKPPPPAPPSVTVRATPEIAARVTAAKPQLIACYVERALPHARGVVDVQLGESSYSRGLDSVGPCVGEVIAGLSLPVTGRTTIAIAFAPQ